MLLRSVFVADSSTKNIPPGVCLPRIVGELLAIVGPAADVPLVQSRCTITEIELGPRNGQLGVSMNHMPPRGESESPADRLQEFRRRTTRRASFSAKDTRAAGMIMARIESGQFDDEALARAIASATA